MELLFVLVELIYPALLHFIRPFYSWRDTSFCNTARPVVYHPRAANNAPKYRMTVI